MYLTANRYATISILLGLLQIKAIPKASGSFILLLTPTGSLRAPLPILVPHFSWPGLFLYPQDGDNTFLEKISKHLPHGTTSHARSPRRENLQSEKV
jgi:hypothetical protein